MAQSMAGLLASAPAITWVRTLDGPEVDFIARSAEGPALLVQVCESLVDPATKEREMRALRTAMRERRLTAGTIVTLDDDARIDTDAGLIRVVPAWRWLLRG